MSTHSNGPHPAPLSAPNTPDARADFVEAMGVLVESIKWMPRMTGRVFGCLLVAERPLTQAELRDELDASLGAISSATRSLLDKRYAQRVSIPGSRQAGIQLHPQVWRNMEEESLADVRDYAALARGAQRDLGDDDSPAAQNLRHMGDYFTAVSGRIQDMLTWHDEHRPGAPWPRDEAAPRD